MKWLVSLTAMVFVLCCQLDAADPVARPVQAPSTVEGDYQDIVYLADTQPILMRLRIRVDGRPLAVVWEDFVTKVFKHLDTNGDGHLDKVEAQRLPPPGVLFSGASGPNGSPAPAFAELDANGDGKVTLAELAAYFRRAGFGPFQTAGGNAGRAVEYFASTFIVDDLVVDSTYAVANGRGNGDSLNDALFKLLDTNGDGKLSKEELLAAPAVLLKRDRNDDEIITPDEISSATSGVQLWESGTTLFLDSSYSMKQQRAGGPFRLVAPRESSLELARALQEKYTPKDKKDGGKGLRREDLGMDAKTFALLDVDGNGRLDTEELARFARRTPDLELNLDLGRKPAIQLVKHDTPMEKKVRAGRDGTLILDLGGTRVDLKSLVAPQADTAQVAKALREQYIAQFKVADRDNNGYLDMTEAMRSPFFRNTFKSMDRDGDGKLFEKEMLAFLDDFLDLQAAVSLCCASVGMTTEGKGLFELLDTDGDGRLSVRELRNAVKLIAELDRDGDGMISRAEIPRCSQAAFRLGPAAPEVSQFTRNDVQILAFSPDGEYLAFDRSRPEKPRRGPEWFRKMDRNGDGDVSRREFLGTDAQFRAIDTDGDGLISVEEAEAFDKMMRAKGDTPR